MAIVRLEGLDKLKNSVTSSGIELSASSMAPQLTTLNDIYILIGFIAIRINLPRRYIYGPHTLTPYYTR
jgi:hypothetical protein